MKHIFTRQAGTGNHMLVFSAMILVSLFCCGQSFAQVGTWTKLTNNAPHYNEGEMILLTNGKVLAKTSSGGSDGYGDVWDELTPSSSGSYLNGTWSSVAAMHSTRLYFSTQVLPSGNVYVAGGEYGTGGNKGEVYNPTTNVWTSAGSISGIQFHDANSELLPGGNVLQASVIDTVSGTAYLSLSTFLYNPASNTYTATANNTHGVDNESEWVKLPDSSILFCDRDLVTGLPTMTSERYIPATNTWVVDAPVPVELFDAFGAEDGPAFLLPNGNVFFMGGASTTAIYTPSGNASPGTWSAGPAIPKGLGAPDAAAAMMNNGKILFALSPAPYGTASDEIFTDPVYFYEYNYLTNAFTLVPNMFGGDTAGNADDEVSGTFVTNMLDLPDGNILFTFQGYDEYWIYTPTASPLAAGQPIISNIINTSCTTYLVTGQLFNGISEGASYGDDWQMNTNYPIVRLTSGSNVYYATTSDWNRIGAVMTGTAPDTARFALPSGIPNGTYSVVLVANGNASAPYSLTINGSLPSLTGATPVCIGATANLGDAAIGGSWSSSNSTIAMVGSASGVVTGLSFGTATISYSIGATCYATAVETVNTAASPITGSVPVCAGSTITLSDVATGGSWSSTNTAAATVTGGIVSAVTPDTVTITYTASAGCAASAVVTINSLPAAIAGNNAICAGATNALSDANTGGGWSVDNISVATVSGSGVETGVGAGTANLTYTTGVGCSVNAVATVNALPSAITGSLPTCVGSILPLSDAISGGAWASGNTAVATIDPVLGNVTGMTPGTAVITYTSVTGCSVTTIVTVNSLPSGIIGLSSVCTGSAITLSDATTGGAWSSGSTTASVNSSGSVSGLTPGTATISYTVTNGCGTNTVSEVITVNAATVAGTVTGTTTMCVDGNTSLSDLATGGVWSSSNTAIATVNASGLVGGVAAGAATISYTVGGSCGSAVATSTVTVTGAPTAGAITGTETVCVNASTTLSDAVTGGAWTSGNTGIATVSASGSVGGVAAGTAAISYTVTGTCSSSVVSTVVTVNPLPVAGTITGTSSVCVSATTTLTDIATGGAWNSSNTTIASVAAGVVRGVAAGTSAISYTVTNSCGSAVAKSVVTVNAVPTVTAMTGTATVCVGATTTLADVTTGGVWSSGSTTIASVASGVVKGVAAGTASISYTITNTCGSTVATKVVTVSAAPAAGTITGTATVCVSATTTLADATTGGVWSSSSATIASVASGVVRGVAAGTATISYTVTNTCSSAVATKVVTVNPAAVAGTITGTATVCVGSTTTLADATTGGAWSSSSSTIASVGTTGIVKGVASGTATISYKVTNSCGSAEATKVVTVSATPTVATISGSSTVTVGATTTLTDATTGGVWSSSSTAKASVSSAGVVRGVATGSATISYTVTNTCGTAHATKAITVEASKAGRESASGVSEVNTEKGLQIYPNPTSGTFTVTTANAGLLYLFSIDGKQVGQFEIKELVSSFSMPGGLAPGMYVYKFMDKDGNVSSGQLVYKP